MPISLADLGKFLYWAFDNNKSAPTFPGTPYPAPHILARKIRFVFIDISQTVSVRLYGFCGCCRHRFLSFVCCLYIRSC